MVLAEWMEAIKMLSTKTLSKSEKVDKEFDTELLFHPRSGLNSFGKKTKGMHCINLLFEINPITLEDRQAV